MNDSFMLSVSSVYDCLMPLSEQRPLLPVTVMGN